MTRTIGPARVADLVAGFERRPAYAGLARALRLAICDGRIVFDTRLPSERLLAERLGVSRTTVTRAYARLAETGYAVARQGAGTFTRVPGGPVRALDRALTPRVADESLIDLNCAASSAPPGLATAYEEALAELPAYLAGHGYYPAGLSELRQAIAQSYDRRGLPTDPDQIMVTPGALAATAVVTRATLRAGDRSLVESPTYPNAAQALTGTGARLLTTPVDDERGWDLAELVGTLRRSRPRATYLVPDFHNPTGHLMTDAEREAVARAAAAAGTVLVVDESHHALALDRVPPALPLAAHAEAAGVDAITVGGISKSVWGGLRVGWLRAPAGRLPALTDARLALDLGVPVLEQLVAARLMRGGDEILAAHLGRLRVQRDALAEAVADRLPEWTFRRPAGGLALWCRLPAPAAVAVALAAEARGVVVTPGPVFAPEGGLGGHLRIPWTRPSADLVAAVDHLAEAWRTARSPAPRRPRPARPIVA